MEPAVFVGAASKLAFPPLIDDHADHGIVEGLNKRHLFDRVQRSVFQGNDVELFLKQADLIAEIRKSPQTRARCRWVSSIRSFKITSLEFEIVLI